MGVPFPCFPFVEAKCAAEVVVPADIKGRTDVLEMGIKAYNDECRSIVMRHATVQNTVWS